MKDKYLYKFDLSKQEAGSWLFAYGLLAAREKNLFDTAAMEQLFQAKDEAEILSLIRNRDFIGDTLDDAILHSEEEDLELMRYAIPDFELIRLLLLEKDFHNLRALLRVQLIAPQRIEFSEIRNLLSGPYSIEPEQILSAIIEQIKAVKEFTDPEVFEPENVAASGILPGMEKAIVEAGEQYFVNYNIAEIDQIVDRYYWQEIFASLQRMKSNWLEEYFRIKIDYKNLELLLRCKSLSLTENDYALILIERGNIDQESWLKLYALSAEELEANLNHYSFGNLPVKEYRELGEAAVFSAQSDARLIEKLKEAKYFPAGQERVAAYLLFRNMQRKSIKIAGACANNKFSAERRRKLVRPGY